MLIARLAESPFHLCGFAQVENNFQSNLGAPSGSSALGWNHPFEIRGEFDF